MGTTTRGLAGVAIVDLGATWRSDFAFGGLIQAC